MPSGGSCTDLVDRKPRIALFFWVQIVAGIAVRWRAKFADQLYSAESLVKPVHTEVEEHRVQW